MATVDNPRFRERQWRDAKGRAKLHWVVDFFVTLTGQPKRHRLHRGGLPSLAAAKAWWRDHQAAIIDESDPILDRIRPKAERPPTVKEFAARYQEATDAKKQPATQKRDARGLKHFAETVLDGVAMSDRTIDKVTGEHIERFIAARIAAKAKEATVARDLDPVRAMFHSAVRWELIPKSPARDVADPKIPDREVVFLELDQQSALLNAAREISQRRDWNAPHLYPLVMLALYTGMRKAELFNLQWGHVDLARKRVTVRNTEAHRTKTGKDRVIGLHADIIGALATWRAWWGQEIGRAREEAAKATHTPSLRERATKRLETLLRCQPIDGTSLVFPSMKEAHPDLEAEDLTLDNVKRALKSAVEAAGITRAVGLQTFRHTFAVTLARQGVPILKLSKALGHATTRTTEKHYLRFYSTEGADVRNSMPSLLAPPVTLVQHDKKADAV